jgi:uncharacterized membrane protein
MADLRAQQVVRAPLARTFQVFTRFEAYPEFMAAIERVGREERNPGWLHWIFSLAGVLRKYATDVRVDTEGHRVSWCSVAGVDHEGQADFSELVFDLRSSAHAADRPAWRSSRSEP